MDTIEFTQRAKDDPQLNAFLSEVAEDANKQISIDGTPQYSVAGVDILFAIAAYALFRLIKDYLDKRQALNEVEILKEQKKVIKALIKDGFPPEDAHAVTVALLQNIAKRSKDDPVLKKTVALLG